MAAGRKVLPWTYTNPRAEQEHFIMAYLEGREDFSALCRRFGVSRKTGYKRLKRYQEWGFEGLGDLSRAPRSHPKQIAIEVEELVVAARLANPTWGPKKLVVWLKEKHPLSPWPAPSTVGNILDRRQLTKPRRKNRRVPPWSQPFREACHPNQVWCADFKGQFRTGDGVAVYPFTLADAYSRYLLACQGCKSTHSQGVRQAMEQVFREYGLPRVIRTDNGSPFATVGLGGLSTLAVWWIKLGIIPERIEPGHPEQNGRLERLHRTLKADTANPPQKNMVKQQQAFDKFRPKYNEERPHEALEMEPPARHYRTSNHPYPSKVRSPEYGDETIVRRVRSSGEIKWLGSKVYLSEALIGEPVGLMPKDDRYLTICFGPLHIGELDTFTKSVTRTPIQVLPMSLV